MKLLGDMYLQVMKFVDAIDPWEAFLIIVAALLVVFMLTISDSADPGLPNCPKHQTASVRCKK